jgi:hypothetical protein
VLQTKRTPKTPTEVAMNIFICWSDKRSQRLAGALRTHLPKFIPGLGRGARAKNIFISDDIAKGTRWFDAVEQHLDRADAGLVCVTREALQSGWIHFEAGALARAVRKKKRQGRGEGGTLYTYLLGVEPEELRGPLAEFQSTSFEREDTKKLCAAIVTSMKNSVPEWERAFDESWAAFETEVKGIGPLPTDKLIPGLEEIFRRKTFNEPLEECTSQNWIERFTGVRETIAGLRRYDAVMRADNSYLLDLYNELLAQLDVYAMNMGALLLKEERFKVGPKDGKLVIGDGIKRACETRRGRIRQLVTHLLAPNCAPVLEQESRRYAKMTTFDAKKTIMIHPVEWEIKQKKFRIDSKEQLNNCATSLWEFDRIYFYLVQENLDEPDVKQMFDCLEQEFEKLRAVDGGTSLVPLHYSIRALKKAFRRSFVRDVCAEFAPKVRILLVKLGKFIEKYKLDEGGQVRDQLEEFLPLVEDFGNAAVEQRGPRARHRPRTRKTKEAGLSSSASSNPR